MRLLAPFALIVAALWLVLSMDETRPRADLVIVNSGEVFWLDPQRMSWLQDFRMGYCLYEGLVRWNTDEFTFEPAAAASLPAISDDRLTYTFSIRPDARWSNGDPVTAHDFIFSWMRALLPDSAADYSMMLFAIDGAREFFDWRNQRLAEFPADRSADALKLWNETEQRFTDTVGLKDLDDRTLQIRLRRPVPYFLDLLAFGTFLPVHRPTVEGWSVDDGARSQMRERGWHAQDGPPFQQRQWVRLDARSGRYEQKHGWTMPPRHVGNGPYVLVQWRYKRGLRLERNPFYHSPRQVKSDSIEYVSIDDSSTAVLAFESGRIDWLSDVSVEYLPDMLDQQRAYERHHAEAISGLLAQGQSLDAALAALPAPGRGERRNVHVLPTFGADFYSFNCRATRSDGRANPFADARVRRAFVLAADRQALVDQVTRLHEPVMTTLIPPDSIPGYENPAGLGFDPARARAELVAAGWEDRDGDGLIENVGGELFPVIDLLYSTSSPRYSGLSLALRDMWQRELGVRIELRGKDSKFFKEDLKRGYFMIARGNWYGDYGDPTTFLDIFRSGDGNNDRGYSNPRVDDLLERAAAEPDPAARMRLLAECERFLFQEEAPMLVICQLVQPCMYEPGHLSGLATHPRLVQYLWRIAATED